MIEQVTSLSPSCPICGCRSFGEGRKGDGHVSVCDCSACGMTRSVKFPGKQELASFYRDYCNDGKYTHSFSQDLETAHLRLKNYDLPTGIKVLDVGSGNGAFVEECSKRNETTGCDLCPDSKHPDQIYVADFLDIHFPTGSFSVLTCHDTIEHVTDPRAFLLEMRRVLVENGLLFLEIPDFFSMAGHKHWKPEHLWYFDREEMVRLLTECGFKIQSVSNPVPSKILFVAKSPAESRVRILVPPGIGDIYWSMTKMRAFLKREGLGMPDVFISSTQPERDRSFDYVHRIPFVHGIGYLKHDARSPFFREAYMTDGKTIFENIEGCHYFISYNGPTRWGKSLEQCDPDLSCEWDLPMWVSLEERKFGQRFNEKHGPFIVLYLTGHGPYQRWVRDFSMKQTFFAIQSIHKHLKYPVVLIGAKWDCGVLDKQIQEFDREGILINLVGKTSLSEAFGLLRASEGVIGYPSGMTIMATAFKRPTLIVWNQYYHPQFWYNSCPPESRDVWYKALDSRTMTEEQIRNEFLSLVVEKEPSLPRSFPVPRKGSPAPILPIATPSNPSTGVKLPETPSEPHPTSPRTSDPGLPGDRGRGEPPAKPSEVGGFVQVRGKIQKPKEEKGVPMSKPSFGKQKDLPSVVCVLRTGGDYEPEYVERLGRMVRRNLFGKDFQFVCLTNYPDWIKGVDVQHPITKTWPGMWSKLEIFKSGLFRGLVLYLDLDTLITGDLKPLLESYDNGFYALHGWHDQRRDRICSAMMMFKGDWSAIYETLSQSEARVLDRNYAWWEEQEFIAGILKDKYGTDLKFLQPIFPIVSFKRHCIRAGNPGKVVLPKEARIVCFHGHPRPHEVVEEVPWVKEVWK